MKRNDLGKTEILKQNPLGEKTTMPWRNRGHYAAISAVFPWDPR